MRRRREGGWAKMIEQCQSAAGALHRLTKRKSSTGHWVLEHVTNEYVGREVLVWAAGTIKKSASVGGRSEGGADICFVILPSHAQSRNRLNHRGSMASAERR